MTTQYVNKNAVKLYREGNEDREQLDANERQYNTKMNEYQDGENEQSECH